MESDVSRRMTRRDDGADAWCDLSLAVDLAHILPGRERRLDALGQGATGLGELVDHRRIGPEPVFGGRGDDLRIGEYLGIAALLHKPEDMVGMEMRNHHLGD